MGLIKNLLDVDFTVDLNTLINPAMLNLLRQSASL